MTASQPVGFFHADASVKSAHIESVGIAGKPDWRDPMDSMSLVELEEIIDSWPDIADRSVLPSVPEIGALCQWRAELDAGARTHLTFDPLHSAACAEANAREAQRLGFDCAANSYRSQSARIVLEAAKRRNAA